MPYRTPRARPRFCPPEAASASNGDDIAPTAFGYLRLSRSDGRKLTRLRSEVADYCTSENLALELVLADSGTSGLELIGPGWTALLDLLGRAASGAIVVVPDLSHISDGQMIRAELCTQSRRSGWRSASCPLAEGRQDVNDHNPNGGPYVEADRTLDSQMRALGVLQKNAGELGVASSRFRLPEESIDATRISGRLHTRLERIAAVHDFTSGLGLSAPQLGLRRAAVAVRTPAGDVTVLVNPRIVAAADETAEEYEGCLSFFSVRGLVRRSVALEVEHQTIDGTYVVTPFADRLARLVAHEVDHLRGILYTDRMTSSVSLIPVRDYRHQP